MLTEARTTNRLLWDSETYRFENATMHDGTLSLALSTIPFSIRFGMNEHTERVKDLGIAYAAMGMFTSCLVQTSDAASVFIEKSDKYFTRKKYAWVGGVLSKMERVLRSGGDLFGALEDEVMEELGVGAQVFDGQSLRAGYLTENWNVCLLFSQTISLSARQLQQRFEQAGDGEAKRLMCIPASELRQQACIFEERDQVKFAILDLL